MNKQTWTTASLAAQRPPRGLPKIGSGFALVCAAVLMGCLSLVTSAQAQGTNSIQAVTASVQGGAEIIRIDLAEPLTAVPTGFSIQTPARIAINTNSRRVKLQSSPGSGRGCRKAARHGLAACRMCLSSAIRSAGTPCCSTQGRKIIVLCMIS